MRKMLLLVGWLLLGQLYSSAQTRYPFPSKTKGFTQWDWLEILHDIANDSQIVQGMKYCKGFVSVENKPYVCYVGKEHPVIFQFCPECVWIVDSCISDCNVGTISLSTAGDYGFHIEGVVAQDMWNPGDTVVALIYLLHNNEIDENCWLMPVASNMILPGYSIFPSKKRKQKIKK